MKLLNHIFTDEKSGRYSSSKFWFNVGNASVVYTYLLFAHKMVQANPINIEGLAILTLVVSGILTSNKLATLFIKNRYGNTNNDKSTDDTKPLKE